MRRHNIKLRLEDKTEIEVADFAELKKQLKKNNAIAVKIGSELKDINSIDVTDSKAIIEPVTFESTEGKEIYRHSTSHIMAHAVKELFPQAKLAIGPSIEDGFYYDFDVDAPFLPEDLLRIEKKMTEIVKNNNAFARKTISKIEAVDMFKKQGETYKVEILNDIADEDVSIYEEGEFVDLCRGPHVASTGVIRAFKLLSIAGAYWRGDQKNKMLQRIYGISFANKEDLQKHLDFLEEVKRRDHRKLGKELDLFSFSEDIGPGLVLWHPNGAIIRNIIENFWRDEHYKGDYKLLYSPHIAKLNLWQKSGHLDFYKDNMYSPMEIDGIEYEIKPMNCPFHINVYKSSLRSYRELPIRYAELGTVYRYERSGVLHGLLRVRGFTQDDAHIFCREDQIEDEILSLLDFTVFVLKTFGFESYDIYLSTRPEKYVGTLESWDKATNALKQALEKKKLSYQVDPGEGVFYGPKIDIKIKDSLNRAWQCSTIQVDFNNPERFDVVFRGSDGKDHRPIMIHRALMGSLERFFGVLVEHYAGLFPLWLSPVQVGILTIAERHSDYALNIASRLKAEGIRVDVNPENEKIGYKIREATMRKIPYLVIIGDKEMAENKITVRKHNGENIGPFAVEEFAEIINKEIKNKS